MTTYAVGIHIKCLNKAVLIYTIKLLWRNKKYMCVYGYHSYAMWVLSRKGLLTLVMLNELRCHTHFYFSANQFTWYKFKYWMANSADLQKLTDLDLYWLQGQGISRFSWTRFKKHLEGSVVTKFKTLISELKSKPISYLDLQCTVCKAFFFFPVCIERVNLFVCVEVLRPS